MSTVSSLHGSANQPIAITFTGLTNNSARQSDVVDDTSSAYLEVGVQLIIKAGASSTSATGYCDVYLYTSADGSNYTDGATGSDGAFTMLASPNMTLLGTVNVITDAATFVSEIMPVAAKLGGMMPAKWGIVLVNKSGGTLDGTTGSAFFQGIKATVA